MHRGQPHFDPTQELPNDNWQGIPYKLPTEEEQLQPGPYQGGYVFPDRQPGLLESLPDTDAPFRAREEEPDEDSLWRKLRRLVEPQGLGETGALIGAGFVPGLDIGIDSVDLIAAIEDKDLPRALWATAGLAIPVASGSSLKQLVGSIEFFKRNAKNIEGTRAPHPDQPNPQAGPKMKASVLSEEFAVNPTAQRMIDEQIEAGMETGGHRWYETGGMYDQMQGTPGMTFDEFHIMGGALSPRSPVPVELMFTSVVNFARQNNIPLEEAQKIFKNIYPANMFRSPVGMGGFFNTARRQADEGWLSPRSALTGPHLGSGSWKTPAYSSGRAGRGSLDINLAGGLPPIDAHEVRSINHIIQQDPKLIDAAIESRYKGVLEDPRLYDTNRFSQSDYWLNPDGGVGLLTNAPTYQNFARPYIDAAKRFDLPTAQSAQGARWEGGRHLGISVPDTPPSTFQGLTERAVREANWLSNQGYGNYAKMGITGGYDDTAAGLLKYWQDVREGRRFIPLGLEAAPFMR